MKPPLHRLFLTPVEVSSSCWVGGGGAEEPGASNPDLSAVDKSLLPLKPQARSLQHGRECKAHSELRGLQQVYAGRFYTGPRAGKWDCERGSPRSDGAPSASSVTITTVNNDPIPDYPPGRGLRPWALNGKRSFFLSSLYRCGHGDPPKVRLPGTGSCLSSCGAQDPNSHTHSSRHPLAPG